MKKIKYIPPPFNSAWRSKMCFCIFIFTLLPSLSIFAQGWQHLILQDTGNYFSLKETVIDYFDSDDSLRFIEGSGYKDFIRWTYFWDDRIDSIGSYATASKQMESFVGELLENPEVDETNYPILANWDLLGPKYPIDSVKSHLGLVATLWIDTANFQTIYAGSNSGGLFRTTNGGQQWESLTDNIGALGVRDIVVYPGNSSISTDDTIYLGIGTRSHGSYYGYGVIKSTNGGGVWDFTALHPDSLNTSSNLTVNKLVRPPDSSHFVYALVDFPGKDSTALYLTKDAFVTVETLLGLPRERLFDIEFKAGSSGTIYVSGNKIHKTTDGGITWDTIHQNLGLNSSELINHAELAVHDDNPEILMVLCDTYNQQDTTSSQRVFKSNDSGDSFFEIHPGDTIYFPGGYNWVPGLIGVSFWLMEIEISMTDTNEFFIGGVYLRKYHISEDTLYINDSIPKGYHVDIRELVVFQGDTTDLVYIGNDGGITKSDDGGIYWEDISENGHNITQFHAFDVDDNSSILLGGTQDGNKNKYDYHLDRWDYHGLDEYSCLIDYNDPDIMYNLGYYNELYIQISNDGGESFSMLDAISDFNQAYSLKSPLIMDPEDHEILYLGLHDVVKSEDQCENWSVISDLTTDGGAKDSQALKTIGISKTNPDFIYAAYPNPTWNSNTNDTVRLVRTKDGGDNWKNITDTTEYYWAGITDLVISPTDSSKFWVSFAHFDGSRKVFQYEKCGDTLINISDSLPNFPVNCITYYEGGALDELFIGTDVGVYYWNDTLDYWIPFNKGLPLCMITDLEINYQNNKLVASTYGRGVWETDLYFCKSGSDSIVISRDTTWSGFSRSVNYGEIIVKSGATLTIEGKVLMPSKSVITVERGARLIVDGGEIYSGCGDMWQGIDVWGTKDSSQHHTSLQGIVELKNSAVIRDALVAVNTARTIPSQGIPYNTPYAGGIIMAEDASFINNRVAVKFWPYENFNPYEPSVPVRNFSYFNSCTFKTNSPLLDDNKLPDAFIYFTDIRGINIAGCTFENSVSYSIYPDTIRGTGIYSYNSNYYIDQRMVESGPGGPDTVLSRFINLNYGIRALGSSTTKTISTKNAEFVENRCGIYMGGIDNANIVSNYYYTSENDTMSGSENIAGLYLDACSGYQVEENKFIGGDSTNGVYGIGIAIYDSGDDYNEIYNNSFEYLNIATFTMDNNRGDTSGLCIKCNDYYNNNYDIAITVSDTTQSGWGVWQYQGSSDTTDATAPAGNVFSDSDGDESDIYNRGEFITYYHHNQELTEEIKVEPTEYSQYYVSLGLNNQGYSKDTSCPSNFGEQSRESLKSTINLAQNSYDETKSEFMLLVDGGDTDNMNLNVQLSTPPEASELEDNLLNESPYLSDTVMKSAIEKEDVLPNAMIRDILVANPQSAKSDEILNILNQREEPMPDYMMADILEGKSQISEKEHYEAKLGFLKGVSERTFNRLCKTLIYDTIDNWANDSLAYYLDNRNTKRAKYQLAFLYMDQNEIISGSATLTAIPTQFELTSKEQIAHQKYQDYFDIIEFLESKNNTIWHLDSVHILSLFDLMEINNGLPSVYARNTLLFLNEIRYNEPYYYPIQNKSVYYDRYPEINTHISVAHFKIYPNPAYDFVIIEYSSGINNTTVESNNNNIFIIRNIEGKLIDKISANGNKDQFVLSTKKLNTGVYVISFYINNEYVESQKLSIIKM